MIASLRFSKASYWTTTGVYVSGWEVSLYWEWTHHDCFVLFFGLGAGFLDCFAHGCCRFE